MKASEQAKQAGLTSLAEMSALSNTSPQTLINWSRDKPELFKVVIAGCMALNFKANLDNIER